jgi:hypothetical protein
MTKRKPLRPDVHTNSRPRTKLGIKDTPQELIVRMNEAHQEWKTTKQVKYNKNGIRMEELK